MAWLTCSTAPGLTPWRSPAPAPAPPPPSGWRCATKPACCLWTSSGKWVAGQGPVWDGTEPQQARRAAADAWRGCVRVQCRGILFTAHAPHLLSQPLPAHALQPLLPHPLLPPAKVAHRGALHSRRHCAAGQPARRRGAAGVRVQPKPKRAASFGCRGNVRCSGGKWHQPCICRCSHYLTH